jgi:hypothetical protein
MVTHKFFTNEEIILFLHSNSCNIFLYDKLDGRGISSVIDYSISVNKPFVISDSYMFRHVYSDNICIYKRDIKTAIKNSIDILPFFLNKYTNKNLINKIEMIIQYSNNKIKGIFYNSKKALCSIHESGLMVYNTLKNSHFYNLTYSEDNEFSYDYDFAIVNEHYTVNNWVTTEMIKKFQKPVFCIVTEVTFTENYIDKSPTFYTAYIVLDPSINEKNNIYGFPRPLEDNTTIKCSDNNVPIIGSFGFATKGKDWHKIVEQTQNEFEEAIVRFNIPFATYVPDSQLIINDVIKICNAVITNPKIKLEITHNNFTKQELINWCAQNTINCFLYNREHLFSAGLCATTDQAIVSEKPLLVSKDSTFRHIHKYIDYYPNISIKQAILQTQNGVKQMKQEWSTNKFINKFENILFKYNKINLVVNNMTKEGELTQLNNNTNKSFNIFNTKITAYYYTENFVESTNVSSYLDKLFCNFIENGNTYFEVSNNIFFDTFPNKRKILFINIQNINGQQTFAYSEKSKVIWTDIVRYIHKISKSVSVSDSSNQIQVSVGEIIDKYSILELKKKYITEPNKINEIQKEMNILDKKVPKNSEFYKQLVYINEQIWLDTDKIKQINYEPNIDNNNFAKLSNNIFENNQKRFRLKNYFNILENSDIKECKSYNNNNCFIKIIKEDEIFNKIPEINYLCISYDVIYFEECYKDIICKIFKNPNISFINNNNNNNNNITSTYNLFKYSIDKELQNIFELNTIKYKSCGRFGDFLNQLSVVCEKFYETGRKGELFIADLDNPDDKFVFGLENTLNDTYPIISSQIFIKDYKIYNNQHVDIDLSTWRKNVWDLVNNGANWYNIFNSIYNVNWNKHQCLTCENDKKWNDKIIIHITPYRFMSTEAINKLKENIKDNLDNCIFMSNEKTHYDYFVQQTSIKIEHYKPKDFQEVVTIINSCKVGFFGFTSSAVVACMLHKTYYIIGTSNTGEMTLNDLRNVFPFILGVLS